MVYFCCDVITNPKDAFVVPVAGVSASSLFHTRRKQRRNIIDDDDGNNKFNT
jgi:hypothetical protein